MIALLLALTSIQPSPAEPEVVVTAARRSTLETALAACLRRHCPPDEDAAAALALADAHFVDGDYYRARSVVTASLGRTRKHRKTYPEPVAELFRTQGRIAAHLGEYDDLKIAAINARETLRDALPHNDPRALSAQLELGDMLVRIGQPRAAEDQYRDVIARAGKAGQGTLAAFARLRLAGLQAVSADTAPSAAIVRQVSTTLAPLTSGEDPTMARFRLPAALFIAKLEESRGDTQAVDRVLRSVPPGAGTKPILLSTDPIRLAQPALTQSGNPDDLVPPDVRRQWVDIGFWINGDGGARDPEVVRSGSPRVAEWYGPVLAAIRSRRYVPLAGDAVAGVYRIERYTLTAGYHVLGDSRIRRRQPQLQIEMFDLTPG